MNYDTIGLVYLEFEYIFPYKLLNHEKEKNENINEKSEKNSENDRLETDLIIIKRNKQNNLDEKEIKLELNIEISLKRKRKMLVYLNPLGGKGKAQKIWNDVYVLFGKKKKNLLK